MQVYRVYPISNRLWMSWLYFFLSLSLQNEKQKKTTSPLFTSQKISRHERNSVHFSNKEIWINSCGLVLLKGQKVAMLYMCFFDRTCRYGLFMGRCQRATFYNLRSLHVLLLLGRFKSSDAEEVHARALRITHHVTDDICFLLSAFLFAGFNCCCCVFSSLEGMKFALQ